MAKPSLGCWKDIQYSIREMNRFLLHCMNEMCVLRALITWEFSTFWFTFRLTDNRTLLSAWCTLSVLRPIKMNWTELSISRTPVESNLNHLIHFSHIVITVINAWSILSLKLPVRYILFLKHEAQRTKQFCIQFGYWDTWSDYGF